MRIERLELRHFRNYRQLTVDFDPQINVLMGANAQGKTNLLEAIYVLALARSHRTNNDRELIEFGTDFAKVEGIISREKGPIDLELILSTAGKRARINHQNQAKLSNYLGQLNVVLFAPEDLTIVKGSPQNRRRFLDMEFGQMSPVYLQRLSEFRQVLRQRNAYLRQLKYREASDRTVLAVLSDQLASVGGAIIAQRYGLLETMNAFASTIHSRITKQRETLQLRYRSQIPEEAQRSAATAQEALQEEFGRAVQREIDQGTTLIGPQRDDLLFIVNEQNVANFGSQGQQRTTALSLKLAEIELMKAQTGEYPILLLDDVLSELDDDRQTHLLNAIQNRVQTFLTTTSLAGITSEIMQSPTTFEVVSGELTPLTK